MPRATRSLAVVAATAALLLGAGCSSTIGGTAAPAAGATSVASTVDPVAWVDKVCGAMKDFQAAGTVEPQITGSTPKAMIKSLTDYLHSLTGVIDTANERVKAAGPSPVAGGDELVTMFTGGLTRLRDVITKVERDLGAVDPSSPAALQKAITPLTTLDVDALFKDLDSFSAPELDAAAENAPNCKAIGI